MIIVLYCVDVKMGQRKLNTRWNNNLKIYLNIPIRPYLSGSNLILYLVRSLVQLVSYSHSKYSGRNVD